MAGTLSAGNILLDAGSNSAPAIAATSSPTVGIVFPAANTIAFSTASVEAMRIDSSGRLGIGITSPTSNLHVIGANIASAIMSSMASSVITSGTANTSLSGTAIDFTGIPSWAKRITLMFSGVSTSGTSGIIARIGSGSVDQTSTYTGAAMRSNSGGIGFSVNSTGFYISTGVSNAGNNLDGIATICLLSGNIYVMNFTGASGTASTELNIAGGKKSLSGVLDRISILTANGTDTFDAGSINVMYE